VVFFFLLLGAFLCSLELRSLVLDRQWLLFAVIAYWHLLPTVRNGFAVFTKPAVFTLMAVLLWLLFRRFVPRTSPRAESTQASRAPASLVR
jgi:membrane protein implicated in regulation of membrane protease activity